jgi:RsiW-degrading membrane proteinase PrsW (M82 family)
MDLLLSIFGSLLLGGVWLRFFRRIDSFEPESWKATFTCLFLGAVSPLFIEAVVGLSPFLGSLSNDKPGVPLLQFAIFRVALVEELVKAVPFLTILLFTRWINESVDYIKYPALSAMGFATVENILYAAQYGIDVLQIRGILCVSGHIFYSALAGYFLWLGSARGGMLLAVPALLLGFGLGVLSHGVYDYFLFENDFAENSGIGLVSVVLCGCFMYAFNKMLLVSLRESQFFSPLVLRTVYGAGMGLFLGLALIFGFIGLSLAWLGGSWMAALNYWTANGFQAVAGTTTLTFLLALDRKDIQKLSRRGQGG